MIDSARVFFTGTVATRGRCSDPGHNVYFAAAAAIIPAKVRGNEQVREVVSLTGLHHDAATKAIAVHTDMDDQCCGWELLTTVKHEGAVDYKPLNRWSHSPAVSTEDSEVRKHARVSGSTGEIPRRTRTSCTTGATWTRSSRSCTRSSRSRPS